MQLQILQGIWFLYLLASWLGTWTDRKTVLYVLHGFKKNDPIRL